MTDIHANLATVKTRVDNAIARRGAGGRVTLVAVSKKMPLAAIEAAYAAGARDFGENYVQELADKALEWKGAHADEPALAWHFIGHLQRNKVKAVLEARPALIHGVDSARLLRELDKRASSLCDVLLQVNVAGEDAKSGCAPSEVDELVGLARTLAGVRVRGLMTMPPIGEPEATRPHFAALRQLAERVGRDVLPELSMGMSHDFEVAIEEGATLVRVGTAIFGARA